MRFEQLDDARLPPSLAASEPWQAGRAEPVAGAAVMTGDDAFLAFERDVHEPDRRGLSRAVHAGDGSEPIPCSLRRQRGGCRGPRAGRRDRPRFAGRKGRPARRHRRRASIFRPT